MPRYILLSFLFMGWAFYELSGGADFAPKARTDVVAETTPAKAAAPATRARLEQSRRERAAQAVVLASAKRQPGERAKPSMELTKASVQTAIATAPKLAFLQPSEELETKVAAIVSAAPEVAAQTEPPVIAPAAVRQPVAKAADLREVAATRVNMRAGPGTGHEILTRLERGQNVEVLENNGSGWLRLRTLPDDQVGWIAERLISKAD